MNQMPIPDPRKQELNCGINITPVINYLEESIGYEKMKLEVESLGLPLKFLLNRKNWISYDYYISLLNKLVELTGDENAPYKMAFNLKHKSTFEELMYVTVTSTAFLSGSPGTTYKLAFSESIYKRFTKIGDFRVLDSTPVSMKVELQLKPGYRQNNYNCMAIQGFMTSVPLGFGLPPAEVIHEECMIHGSPGCIYQIRWQNSVSHWLLYAILFLATSGTAYITHHFFQFPGLIITLLTASLIVFISRLVQFSRRLKTNEIFYMRKNDALISAMEKIEHDYQEIQDTKSKLVERNIYLSVVNEINQIILENSHITPLLNQCAEKLKTRLKLDEAYFYLFTQSGTSYQLLFYLLNGSDTIKPGMIHELKPSTFQTLKDLNFSDLPANLFFEGNPGQLEDCSLFSMPVQAGDSYQGFFLFISRHKSGLSKEMTYSLLQNLSGQLRTAIERILSRKTIENILSGIPSYVLIFSPADFRIHYANQLFLRTFPGINNRYSEDEINERHLFELIPFTDEIKAGLHENLENHQNLISTSHEITIENTWLEYSFFRIPQLKDNTPLMGIILNDITEAKHFQQKLLLNEKLIALGRVASGIAHEINNPLYAVLSNAEEIGESKEISPQNKEYADEIVEHVLNISNIIKDLSSYSKTLRNEKEESLDLNQILDESIKLVRYGLNFSNVEVVRNYSQLPVIQATKGEMEQIFINLINNAVQSMEFNPGRLELTTRHENNHTLVIIRDTGKGIPPENLPYIFDLYFTTKNPGEGTGQGLHIVKKIVTKYQGEISCNSVVARGTEFIISFKLAPS